MDVDLAYRVRRSERARRVRVAVDARGGVEVTLPAWARASEAPQAVAQVRPWIARRQAEAAAARERVAAPDGHVAYLGTMLALVPEQGRARVLRRGDALLVPGDDAVARSALERWYRRRAQAEIAPRVAAATAALDRTCTSIAIRAQRTRWGSCSPSGALSFNWRLMLAPVEVLEYVVWHEACHLVELNHSPRFWTLVGRFVPGYREPQRWLRLNGSALVLPDALVASSMRSTRTASPHLSPTTAPPARAAAPRTPSRPPRARSAGAADAR